MIKIVILSMALLISIPNPAHAYMDPGTGSLVLQLIIGGIAGALVALKLFWKRITSFFKRK